ncbi:uncharacterized protein [Macrobrachium rosenbergii]|uniref:uncharacterized protein n=1 Tax=Macrobrachium rosenbergii TaxID=79674 RepID=UPI0034D5488F
MVPHNPTLHPKDTLSSTHTHTPTFIETAPHNPPTPPHTTPNGVVSHPTHPTQPIFHPTPNHPLLYSAPHHIYTTPHPIFHQHPTFHLTPIGTLTQHPQISFTKPHTPPHTKPPSSICPTPAHHF